MQGRGGVIYNLILDVAAVKQPALVASARGEPARLHQLGGHKAIFMVEGQHDATAPAIGQLLQEDIRAQQREDLQHTADLPRSHLQQAHLPQEHGDQKETLLRM